jgi:hypothetical protein
MIKHLPTQTVEAMKSIANNPAWDILVEGFIIPEMEKLNSVYDIKDLVDKCIPEIDLKADVLARIKAYGKIEMIIMGINKYRKEKSDPFSNEMDNME